jgi:glycosyltransferase involved in cell wall biosynthesis
MTAVNIKPKILFISSGATVTGVPIYFINLIGWFKLNTDFDITILTALGGPLESEYSKLATTYKWDDEDQPRGLERVYPGRVLLRIARKVFRIQKTTYHDVVISNLSAEKFDLIYINSVASLWLFEAIQNKIKAKTILHVHELQISILQFCGLELFKRNIPHIDHFIAISNAVEMNLIEQFDIPDKSMTVVYTFVNNKEAENLDSSKYKEIIRNQTGIPQNAFVVASSGTTDWRKGADLVVHIAKEVLSRTAFPIYFLWIGGDTSSIELQKLNYDLVRLNLQNKILFLGTKENPLEYFAAADVFMLCSREDPVGLVALEAASLGKPVLCFAQAGGMPEFVEDDCGFIIPYLDFDTMADYIIQLQENKDLLQMLGENAARKVKIHDVNIAGKKIVTIIHSVIGTGIIKENKHWSS